MSRRTTRANLRRSTRRRWRRPGPRGHWLWTGCGHSWGRRMRRACGWLRSSRQRVTGWSGTGCRCVCAPSQFLRAGTDSSIRPLGLATDSPRLRHSCAHTVYQVFVYDHYHSTRVIFSHRPGCATSGSAQRGHPHCGRVCEGGGDPAAFAARRLIITCWPLHVGRCLLARGNNAGVKKLMPLPPSPPPPAPPRR